MNRVLLAGTKSKYNTPWPNEAKNYDQAMPNAYRATTGRSMRYRLL